MEKEFNEDQFDMIKCLCRETDAGMYIYSIDKYMLVCTIENEIEDTTLDFTINLN